MDSLLNMHKQKDVQVLIKTELEDEIIFSNKIKNPWAVSSLKEFLMYNCPECDFKVKQEFGFYEHAIKSHTKAQ